MTSPSKHSTNAPCDHDTEIAQLLKVIEKKSDVIAQQKHRIATREEYLRLERARRFGAS